MTKFFSPFGGDGSYVKPADYEPDVSHFLVSESMKLETISLKKQVDPVHFIRRTTDAQNFPPAKEVYGARREGNAKSAALVHVSDFGNSIDEARLGNMSRFRIGKRSPLLAR